MILESYNDYIQGSGTEDLYGTEIKIILRLDYNIHKVTIEDWSCADSDLEDSFAITPLIRSVLRTE